MIGPHNIEEKIFQYFEGDLTANESLELESFIKDNPEYQVDFDAWSKSGVQDEKREYKFVDELLVNERFQPNLWLKWASGGLLFAGLIMASAVLIRKFDKIEEKINLTQNAKIELDLNKQNYISGSDSFLINKNSGSQSINDLNIKRSKKTRLNTNYQDFLQSNLKRLNLINASSSGAKDDLIKDDANTSQIDFSIKFKGNSKNNNQSLDQQQKECFDCLSNENLIVDKNKKKRELKKSYISTGSIKTQNFISSERLNPAIRKSKFAYENPNTPKLFMTNSKDPYLNYALAHTIEENASFVGGFNNGDGIRAEMLYRTEWPSVTSENFTSQIVSLDTKIDALKGGLGLLVNADRIGHGKLNSTAISIIYSPKFLWRKISIEPSFKYTYNQKSIAWNQVEKNDVKDPRNGVLYASIPIVPDDILKTNLVHHDLGLGILINTNKLYFGGQIDHLNEASYTHDEFDQKIEVPFKISAMIGTEIMKNKESQFRVCPSVNYIQYGVYNALWGNTQVFYNGFFLAGGFASNEDVMFSLGFTNNKVRLVYGLGFSKPREFSGLPMNGGYYESHQLSLRVNLNTKM